MWQGRVSPVLDVAGQLLVVELDGSAEIARRQETLSEAMPDRRAQQLLDMGVDALICGAISRPLESLLAGRLRLMPRVCGEVDEVVRAFLANQLDDRFAMPGCCGRQGRRRQGRCRCRKRTEE